MAIVAAMAAPAVLAGLEHAPTGESVRRGS
jgi:hypothetical protein